MTLLNLKTFHRVEWSNAGFEPGEIDAVDAATVYGYLVEIQPELVSYVHAHAEWTPSCCASM